MNIQPLFEKITDKWVVKVICFVIALLLYVMHQTASVEKKSFIVPLSVKEGGAVVSVGINDERGNEINTVKLIVRAEADDIAKVEAQKNNIKAYLDISHFAKEDTKKVSVYLDLPDELKLIEPLEITAEPDSVFVKMEPMQNRYVPIVLSITGDVDRGYVQTSTSVVPNAVLISGPKSIVSEVENIITEDIDVVNHYDSFSVKTKLVNKNNAISVQMPDEITVSIGIAAIKDLKLFNNVAVQFTGIRPEVKIAEKSAQQTISVNLSGNLLFLENLSPSRIQARVDCSKVVKAGEYELPVSIFVPSGAVLADKEKKTLKVVFEDSIIATEEVQSDEKNSENAE